MPLKTSIKIPFARRANDLVHISAVESGLNCDCFCVACDNALIAKKGNSGRVPHFAHMAASNCKPETALHHLGKIFLAERIKRTVADSGAIPMSWTCSRCGEQHSGNLLKRATDVRVEGSLGSRVPDLTLLDKENQVCGIVEIVVSHEPEPGARSFYHEQKIPMVEIHLTGGESLNNLFGDDELKVDHVSFCPVPSWKLRMSIFAGTPMKLGETKLEIRGASLHVQGLGDPAPVGVFYFDSPELTSAALDGLKSGAIAGLYEPELMSGIVHQRDINLYANKFRKLGLRAYEWNFCGLSSRRWKRRVKRHRRHSR